MNKKIPTVIVGVIILSLVVIYTIASTYAIIIEVKQEDGVNEIVNVIRIRDLVTNDDGTYNNTYYDVKNELNITDAEATLIMESEKLNENLQIILNSIVDYKLNNNINAKLTNDEIYNLIVEGVNNTNSLSQELRDKVINKANIYKQDVSDFVYDIDVALIGGNL